jgi:hypothetical protein
VNTKHECCNCAFCTIPRVLSLAIEKGAFADPTPAPIPTPKPARRISMATAGRQLSALAAMQRARRDPDAERKSLLHAARDGVGRVRPRAAGSELTC